MATCTVHGATRRICTSFGVRKTTCTSEGVAMISVDCNASVMATQSQGKLRRMCGTVHRSSVPLAAVICKLLTLDVAVQCGMLGRPRVKGQVFPNHHAAVQHPRGPQHWKSQCRVPHHLKPRSTHAHQRKTKGCSRSQGQKKKIFILQQTANAAGPWDGALARWSKVSLSLSQRINSMSSKEAKSKILRSWNAVLVELAHNPGPRAIQVVCARMATQMATWTV